MIRWLLDLIRRSLPWDGWDEPHPDNCPICAAHWPTMGSDSYDMAVEPWR